MRQDSLGFDSRLTIYEADFSYNLTWIDKIGSLLADSKIISSL